jgi:hypothetical protein
MTTRRVVAIEIQGRRREIDYNKKTGGNRNSGHEK